VALSFDLSLNEKWLDNYYIARRFIGSIKWRSTATDANDKKVKKKIKNKNLSKSFFEKKKETTE
jgi:hypothetical protein